MRYFNRLQYVVTKGGYKILLIKKEEGRIGNEDLRIEKRIKKRKRRKFELKKYIKL